MPTPQDEWMQALGVAPEKLQLSAVNGGGAAVAPAPVRGLKFEFDVPVPKWKPKAWGGKIEFELAVKPHLKGVAAVDDANKSKITAAGTKAVFAWQQKTAAPVLNSGNIFTNAKLARKGASLVATSSTDTAIGKFEIAVTFVKVDTKLEKDASLKFELKVGEVEGALTPVTLKLPDQEIEGIQLSNLELAISGSISIAPQWFAILEQWAMEAGKSYLKDLAATAAEDTVVVVSGDVVIAGSIVVAGVAGVAASIYGLVQAWGIGDLAKSYDPSVAATKNGFKAGMSGGPEPSDRFGKAGHSQGKKNFDKLFAKAKQDNPDAGDDAIKKAIAARADEALAQVADPIEKAVRVALWDGYLGQHKGSFPPLLSEDAKWAYVASFGDLPDKNGLQWKKYLDQHPTASSF